MAKTISSNEEMQNVIMLKFETKVLSKSLIKFTYRNHTFLFIFFKENVIKHIAKKKRKTIGRKEGKMIRSLMYNHRDSTFTL